MTALEIEGPDVAHGPLRAALLRQAEAEAAALVADAAEPARRRLAAARAEAADLIARARTEAEAEADRTLARGRAAARRQARALVLAAQREVYDELRRQARAAAEALTSDPAYQVVVAALVAHAIATLGDEARLDLDPAGRPGVLAEAGGRRLDLTLAAFADAVVDELAGEVERLWT